ncbi:restriction endonuclease subunit S [Enterococcus faecalis]|uniref:restriction endonuclease subunit S n=1 Tax=Enterococcus faecalis TaxID=1351 RepID=UPI0034CF5250
MENLFNYNWELCKLGELIESFDSERIPIDSSLRISGQYPYYGATGIIDYIDSYIFDGEYVLLAEDGANIIMRNYPVAYLTQGKFWLNNHAHIMRMVKGDNQFLVQILEKMNYSKYNTGTAQPKLNSNIVKRINLRVPIPEEQQKIGTLFKQLDDTITLHQRKLDQLKELKKAYLKAMLISMNTKNNKVPKLRFADFEGEWDQRKFKAFSKKTGKKNSQNLNYPAYSVSNKTGLISQSEQFDGNRLDTLEKLSYKIVKPYEFVYNPARINVGSIAFNTLGKPVIVSSLYVVLQMEDNLNNDFILQFIKSPAFVREVKRNTEGSVREYLFYENFANIKFPYTKNIKEQQKIGAFLKKIDDTITLHQNKLTQLKSLKKSYLQNMFI